ncbi:MAG: AsmA family protein [Candidatus Zixiibacteriota bacterium]
MKKLLKILLWIAGIFVGMIILAVIGLKLFFPVEKAKAYAVREGSAALGRPLTVEDLDLSFWGGLGIKLVEVGVGNPEGFKGEPLLKAENVDIKLRLLPLLTKNFRINRLIINKPIVNLLKNTDGANNFTFAAVDTVLPPEVAKLPAETKAASAAVSFDRFEINDGNLVYVDDSSGVTLKLNELNLATTLSNPRENYYESSGKLDAGEIELTLDEPYPSYAIALNYEFSYDVTGDHLAIEQTDLELNGLKFKLNGEVAGVLDKPDAKLNVKSDKISVADLFKLLPEKQLEAVADFEIEGDFSFNTDLEYNASVANEPLVYTGSATISDMKMIKKDIPGHLTFRRAIMDFKNDNLRMVIEEGSFDSKPFKGHLLVKDFENPTVDGELAGNFNLVFLEPFLPAQEKHKVTGDAGFDMKFSGAVKDYTNMNFSGNLDIQNGTYNSTLLPEPIESFALDLYFDQNLVNVKNFNARTKSGDLSFDGRVYNLVAMMLADSAAALKIHPSIDGHLAGNVNLTLLNGFLPEKGHPEMKGLFAMDLQLNGSTGNLENFQVRGKASVKDAAYTDSLLPEPIRNFAAEMDIQPDTIDIKKFDVKFVSSDVFMAGKLANPFPYLLPLESIDRSKVKRPLFNFELSSKRFDVDKLFPEAVPGSGAVTPGEGISVDSVSMVMVPDIDGRGTFKIDTLIYTQIEFTNIEGKLKYLDRKITAYEVTGKVYSGLVSGETTVDLNDFDTPRYTGKFSAKQIEVNDFVDRFSKFGGFVYGKIDLNGDYDAAGWEPDQFLNSLTMNGVGDMLDGKLVTSGAINSLLSNLAEKTGQTFDKEQPLKNLKSNITVKDGKVYLDNMKSRLGSIGDLEVGGYYGFNNDIEYTGTILLSEETTKKLTSQGGMLSGLAGILSDDETGRVKLPIKIFGTVDKPEADIDYSALTKNAGDNLKDKATDLFQGLIKKKK